MTTNRKEIKDTTLVSVTNMGIGEVGYTINNGSINIRRNWALPNTTQEVELKELKMAINEAGVRQLFEVFNKDLKRYEDGELLIKNENIREILALQPIGKYTLDKEQMIDLFTNDSLEKLEEVLENCPNATLDKIVQEAINMPLDNMSKLNLIKAYSGKDIFAAIQAKKEQLGVEKKRTVENNTSNGENTSTRRKKV